MPHSPKPPARMVMPSWTPARLSAALALETILFNGFSFRPGGRPGSHGAWMRRGPLANVFHRVCRRRARTEEPPDTMLAERFHVLGRNDAAAGHQHMAGPLLAQQLHDFREDRHVR